MSDINKRDLWQTKISCVKPHKITLRGYPLEEVMEKLTFTEGLYLTIKGRLPEEKEIKMLNALLNTIIDHEFINSTIPAARYIASANPQIVPAIAGGILTAGKNTLSPQDQAEFINAAYELKVKNNWTLEEAAKNIVNDLIEKRNKIPGLGHPIHKKYDPRAVKLKELAIKYGWYGEKIQLYEAIHSEFCKRTNKELPINADGMMAGIMNEMGLTPLDMVGINLLSYLPGIISHVIEEITNPIPLRTIADVFRQYIGEPERHLD